MDQLTVIILLLISLTYFFFQFRSWWANYQKLEGRLKAYYLEQGLEVLSISKLSMAERIKYGVPMSPFVSFYYSSFSLFTAKNKTVCRSVETRNEAGTEHIRYVEVSFTGAEVIGVNEFEVYEF